MTQSPSSALEPMMIIPTVYVNGDDFLSYLLRAAEHVAVFVNYSLCNYIET